MPRLIKIGAGVAFLAAFIGGGAGFALSHRQSTSITEPSVTVSAEPTETLTETATVTNSTTMTLTSTVTDTPSPTATVTPTLSTLVVLVTAVNPDVALELPVSPGPTLTPSLLPTVIVPTPAAVLNLVPTGDIPPLVGWLRYTADNAAIQHTGKWDLYSQSYRSAGHGYLFTNDANASLSLHFLGAAARVRYPRLFSYGIFELRLDGRVVSTVDAYLSETIFYGDFATTEVFNVPNGWHTLEIHRLDRHNPASTNGFVAIDTVDIFQDGAISTTGPTSLRAMATSTPSPAPVQKIQILIAPPTIPSTPTLAPPQVTSVSLTIAYDLNGDKAVEPGEGVADLPVQLIAADTNRLVASGNTDAQGYIHLETTGTQLLRLVVPYFNRFWDVPPHAAATRITLLLPPANSPALIP